MAMGTHANSYNKYIKYKTKYLKLKANINMVGGGRPSIDILKDINLFPEGSEIEQYLNPIYGFLWIECNAITNYYNFGDPEKHITNFIKKVFYKIPGTVQPTKILFKDVSTRNLGRFLAYKYVRFSEFSLKLKLIFLQIKQCIKNIKISNNNESKISKCNVEINELNQLVNNINDKYYLLINSIDFLNDNNSDLIKKELNELQLYFEEYDKNSIIPSDINIRNRVIRGSAGWKENNVDINMFHVMLAVVWWNAHDKNGIKEFYEGVNEILSDTMKVTIPDDFVNNNFTKDHYAQTNTNNYYLALAAKYKESHSDIILHDQEYTNIKNPCDVTFADCGISSLRNFIKILIYNSNKYDKNILVQLGANENVIQFFDKFHSENLQSSVVKINIFDEMLNARDAWGKVTCNIDGVKYLNECTLQDGSIFQYEMNDGYSMATNEDGEPIDNMLHMISSLFDNVNDWDDITTILPDFEIEPDLNEGIGTILINNDVQEKYYIWHLQCGHYYMENNISKIKHKVIYNEIDKKKLVYVSLIGNNIKNITETNNLYDDVKLIRNDDWQYFLLYGVKYISYLFARSEPSMQIILFKYINSDFDDDKKLRVALNLDNINNILDYDLTKYGIIIEYDLTLAKTLDNIKSITFKSSVFTKDLINLKCLKFNRTFNRSVVNLFTNLTKLETLQFGAKFNQPLENSLNNLHSLNTLQFGEMFNQSIDNSLNNLHKLNTLQFGKMFNRPLNNSLDNLYSLNTLQFGAEFNQPLNNSLNNLHSLNTLQFGEMFNQSIDNSLNNLHKLNTLHFKGSIYDSLNGLTSLTSLTCNNFSDDAINSLGKLISLEKLSMLHAKTQVNDQLKNLTKLKYLKLYGPIELHLEDVLSNFPNLMELDISKFKTQYKLHKLQKLTHLSIKNHTQPDLFYKLTHLKSLTLEYARIPLDHSLDSLESLESLSISNYEFELKNTLDKLTNLQSLSISNYKFELKNTLDKLTNLQNLTLDISTELGTSLDNLSQLKRLTFGDNFTHDIGHSLDNLIQLRELQFGPLFSVPIDGFIYKLTNLEQLEFGHWMNYPLTGISTITHTKLKAIYVDESYPYMSILNEDVRDKLILKNRFAVPFSPP